MKTEIDAGKRLVDSLIERRFPLAAALWVFSPELSTYRLLVATPLASTKGPLAAYRLIEDTLEANHIGLALERIEVVTEDEPIVQRLTKLFQLGPKVGTMRIHRTVLEGMAIEDALVYVLRRRAGHDAAAAA
ncbi:MAG: hypothetical protein ACYDCK_06175 [Thermoplasmatota archaeon]